MPTVTERRSDPASDRTRTPLSSRLARIPSARGTLWFLEGFLAGEADLAGLVDLEHLHVDDVALADDVRHGAHPLVGELRDVHEPVRSGHDLDEGAEIDHAPDRAAIDLAHLGLGREAADALDRAGHGVAVGRRHEHGAVV